MRATRQLQKETYLHWLTKNPKAITYQRKTTVKTKIEGKKNVFRGKTVTRLRIEKLKDSTATTRNRKRQDMFAF